MTNYLLTGRKDDPHPARVLWTSTRELALEEPREAAVLMRATAAHGNTEKPVQHLSMGLLRGHHHWIPHCLGAAMIGVLSGPNTLRV